MVVDFRFVRGYVPVVYKCSKLGIIQVATIYAVYYGKYGWLCDCGYWTLEYPEYHEDIEFGYRDVFVELVSGDAD